MQRILLTLEPGMRRQVYQVASGSSNPVAVQRLITDQLAQLTDWNPNPILRRWHYTPPRPKFGKGNPNGSTAAEAIAKQSQCTPGTLADSPLDQVIQGLRRHCPDITTPMVGVLALDAGLRKIRIEVSQTLISNAEKRLDDMVRALATTAGVTSSDLKVSFYHALGFRVGMWEGKYDASRNHLPGALQFMENIGLLVRFHVIPAEAPWTPPPGQNCPQEIYAPFDAAAHSQLNALAVDTGLGKEFVCNQLMVSALAQLHPCTHLARQLESHIMRQRFKEALQLDKALMNYESRLKAPLAPQEEDPTLAPFIDGLATALGDLRSRGRIARDLLASAILSRGDDVVYLNLIKRANQARSTARLCQGGDPLPIDALQKVLSLLRELF
jgi:hypothetical protein